MIEFQFVPLCYTYTGNQEPMETLHDKRNKTHLETLWHPPFPRKAGLFGAVKKWDGGTYISLDVAVLNLDRHSDYGNRGFSCD